jgi:hypothetical protein
MKLFSRLILIAIVFGITVSISIGQALAAAPVLVKQCTVTKPRPLSHNASGTQIEYVIYGKKNAASITFLVGYRNAAQNFLRRVTDYGSFSPGTTINHHFDLYNDVTYAGSQTQSCVPIQVKWADSTLWIAPSH